MNSKSTIILSTILFLTITSFGQKKDSLTIQLETQYRDAPDSLVDSLLQMVYGKLNPDIEKMLADSGAFNADRKRIGRWNEYFYKPCILCAHEKINYDSIVKQNEENQGNISFLKETGAYKNGKREGVWNTYSTEKLDKPFEWRFSSTAAYLNNKKEGWENRYLYSKNSTHYLYRRLYYQDGMENGPVYRFNSNGDTTMIGQNKNGLAYGLFKFKKDDIFPLSFDRVYENGIEIESIFHHKNGVVASRGLLIEFRPHGVHKSYNETGELVMEQMYNFGILEGVSKYYENGKLISTQTFSENELNGSHMYYHSNGQLWTELEMKSNKPWRVKSNFDKNGRRKSKGNLKNGNGTMKRYDDNGKLVTIEYYKNGELIKEETK
jgi:antitoxin component YwqK of YwqJK toxin-antitoxin module